MLTNLMVKSTVELASAMMLKLTLTNLLLEVNKDILFFLREEMVKLKYSGDLEKIVANIMDPSILFRETLSRRNISCPLEIGQLKFGLKS
jgi:hypothetical protein